MYVEMDFVNYQMRMVNVILDYSDFFFIWINELSRVSVSNVTIYLDLNA